MEKILHLTLKKKWFDMIASGEKKEEYRSIGDYWCRRFCGKEHYKYETDVLYKLINVFPDVVVFRNGYGKNRPTIKIECKRIGIGNGISKWGGDGLSFIIYLGKILSIKNYDQ
jgi:hypothetical protein